jgi:hypothetical protein
VTNQKLKSGDWWQVTIYYVPDSQDHRLRRGRSASCGNLGGWPTVDRWAQVSRADKPFNAAAVGNAPEVPDAADVPIGSPARYDERRGKYLGEGEFSDAEWVKLIDTARAAFAGHNAKAAARMPIRSIAIMPDEIEVQGGWFVGPWHGDGLNVRVRRAAEAFELISVESWGA